MRVKKLSALLYLLGTASIVSTVFGDSLLSSLSVTLCGIVSGIQAFIGILSIALFLVGGVLYAVAHFIPTSIEFRKSSMGWAQAMIIGGVIGLIVVILALPLVKLIAGFAGATGGVSIVTSC